MLLHTGQLFSPHQDPGLPLQQGGALPTGFVLFIYPETGVIIPLMH